MPSNRVDRAEQLLFAADGTYTASLAELVARDKVLASELTIPLEVTLDVGANGKSYVATLTSDVFSVVPGAIRRRSSRAAAVAR